MCIAVGAIMIHPSTSKCIEVVFTLGNAIPLAYLIVVMWMSLGEAKSNDDVDD